MALDVLIVSDGSPVYGYGHISRSSELANAFAERGLSVEHVNLSDTLQAAIDQKPARLTVLDLPYAADDRIHRARDTSSRIIALDYLGQGGPDVVIRMNAPLTTIPCGRLVHGLEFAIIRRSIRQAEPAAGDYVLVSIGGADVANLGYDLAAKLSDLGAKPLLIRGPLAKRDSDKDRRFNTLRAPDNFPHLLARSAWVVCNGGTTMVEAMSRGKAVHVIPQNSEEDRFARPLCEAGLLLGVGADELRVPGHAQIQAVGARARPAVDGKGSERIVNIGLELLSMSIG